MTTQEEYAERRERWAAALESGQYAQTREQLRSSDGFCCLGVACDLYAQENGGTWAKRPIPLDGYEFKEKVTTLPEEVRAWLGLTTDIGGYGITALAEMNDGGVSFAAIAHDIRRAPRGLFSRG